MNAWFGLTVPDVMRPHAESGAAPDQTLGDAGHDAPRSFAELGLALLVVRLRVGHHEVVDVVGVLELHDAEPTRWPRKSSSAGSIRRQYAASCAPGSNVLVTSTPAADSAATWSSTSR